MTDPAPPSDTGSSSPPHRPPPKPLNTFQLLGVILAGAIGIRRTSDRGGGVSNASTSAIVGAVLIFLGFAILGMYAFVSAVKNAAGS